MDNNILAYQGYRNQQKMQNENDRKCSNCGDGMGVILLFIWVALGRWYYGLIDSYIDGETMRIYSSIFLTFLSLVFYEMVKIYLHMFLGLVILVGLGIETFKIFF